MGDGICSCTFQVQPDLIQQLKIIVKKRQMNLSSLRQKYQQILHQPESDDSEEEWENAYSRMKNERKKRILTESTSHNMQRKQTTSDNILQTKQKLAQSLAQLSQKNQQIVALKEQNVRLEENCKGLQGQISSLKEDLSNLEGQVLKQKIQNGCIEKEKQNLIKSVESQKIDKDLMQHQIVFYKEEIENLKKRLKDKDKCYEGLTTHLKTSDKYKAENLKLREDVKRMKLLLSQLQQFKFMSNGSEQKHYLGKIAKEHECWFSADLISETEAFLKKQKVGYGNKEFLVSLVKFISKKAEMVKKDVEKKQKKICTSKIKEMKRKQNQSLHLVDFHQGTLQRSILKTSLSKSRRTKTLYDSKRCTQSFIYDKLEKSLIGQQVNHNRDLCVEMLTSFRKGVEALFGMKEMKKKKMMKLIDWMIEGILSVFPSGGEGNREITMEADSIKIIQ